MNQRQYQIYILQNSFGERKNTFFMTLIKDYDILFEVKKSVTFSILHFNIEQMDCSGHLWKQCSTSSSNYTDDRNTVN